MSDASDIVERLADAEGETVALCFADRLRIPTEPYDGISRRIETVDATTIRARIDMAEIEDGGISLMCIAYIDDEREQERLGLPTDGMPTEPNSDRIGFEISTSRDPGLPWNYPKAYVSMPTTDRCNRRFVESDYSPQYMAPNHELGEIWNVLDAESSDQEVETV